MNNSIDMKTAPKTDQLNYDDIPNGKSITITITGVKGNTDPQQPISVHYEGDGGKPYKPGLSMRRAMVEAWGDDGIEYVGKSMTLFGDPTITFGPNAVGGIRISHMSHMDRELHFPLTVSRGKKTPYIVKQLKVDMGNVDTDEENKAAELLDAARIAAKQGKEVFTVHFNTLNEHERAIIKTNMEELQAICLDADEIPVDPTSQDQEAGNVESEDTSPPVDADSTTPEPIKDKSKHLSRNDIIKALSDCGTEDEVDTLITCQSLGIAKKSEGDQITISNAAIDRKKELSDA